MAVPGGAVALAGTSAAAGAIVASVIEPPETRPPVTLNPVTAAASPVRAMPVRRAVRGARAALCLPGARCVGTYLSGEGTKKGLTG